MKRIENKVIIVTGAARGIGRAASLLFAQEGGKVAVTDVRDDEGREVVGKIIAAGGEAEFWRMDVTRELEIERVFREIHQQFGRIDVLVNNAGIVGTSKPTHETTEAEWDEIQAVNVKGVFLGTKHVIRYLREAGGGSIVNISSI